MRLFVAIDIEDTLKRKILKMQREIASCEADVKFVEPENLHFTLKFLGEVNDDRIKEISSILKDVVENFKTFKIEIKGLGYFGSPNFIRVIWLNVGEGREKLRLLTEAVGKPLEYIRRENKQQIPHLTIGRVRSAKNKEKLLHVIRKLSDVKIGEMDVKFVKLKQSILSKKGPRYIDVKVFKLK